MIGGMPSWVRGRSGRRRWRLLVLVVVVVAAVAAPAAVVASRVWIGRSAARHVYDVAGVPAAPVALVLGAQVRPDGTPSSLLAARLEVARQLFAAGRVRVVLVSGDNGSRDYDEPGAMRRWLVERGVPAARVVGDGAGFDTYDSCLRARRVFGVREVIVVTQSFHVRRAVALCREVGVSAVGVGDDSVSRYGRAWRWGVLREYPAGVKAAVDVLRGRDPAVSGPRVWSVDDALRS
jgi:vancomycin permeability regulator SanA